VELEVEDIQEELALLAVGMMQLVLSSTYQSRRSSSLDKCQALIHVQHLLTSSRYEKTSGWPPSPLHPRQQEAESRSGVL